MWCPNVENPPKDYIPQHFPRPPVFFMHFFPVRVREVLHPIFLASPRKGRKRNREGISEGPPGSLPQGCHRLLIHVSLKLLHLFLQKRPEPKLRLLFLRLLSGCFLGCTAFRLLPALARLLVLLLLATQNILLLLLATLALLLLLLPAQNILLLLPATLAILLPATLAILLLAPFILPLLPLLAPLETVWTSTLPMRIARFYEKISSAPDLDAGQALSLSALILKETTKALPFPIRVGVKTISAPGTDFVHDVQS